MSATARWFGPEERPLFGWVHRPDTDLNASAPTGQRPAVVLCPPVGREMIDSHYEIRLLGQMLAAVGIMAIRFDYDGTGDSAGEAEDPNRLEAWLDSIEHAVMLARSYGATSIALVGLRMGTLLSELVAPRIDDLAAVVLWDPCTSGRQFVRQTRALEMLRVKDYPERQPYDGAPGALISAATLDDIKQLRVPELTARQAPSTLVLHRPGDSTVTTLLERFGDRPLTVESAEGQPEMLNAGLNRKVTPYHSLERIVNWLSAELADPSSPGHAAPAVEALGAPDDMDCKLCSDWEPCLQPAVVRQSADGSTRICERILKLGESGLFGIETFPGHCGTSFPTIICMNGGLDWRAGPSRMWTRLAREWAALGFRTLRFDFSGLGDSPARPGCRPQTAGAAETFDDLDDVLSVITPQDRSNVILVGHCSSGYTALEYGLVIEPRAILSVNPNLAFTPPEAVDGPVDPRRRIWMPVNGEAVSTYRRFVPSAVRGAVRPLAWRVRRMLLARRTELDWILKLLEARTDVITVCGPDDLHQLPPLAQKSIAGTADSGSMRVEMIDGFDHGLMHPDDQDDVRRIFTGYLVDRFVGDGAKAVGPEEDVGIRPAERELVTLADGGR